MILIIILSLLLTVKPVKQVYLINDEAVSADFGYVDALKSLDGRLPPTKKSSKPILFVPYELPLNSNLILSTKLSPIKFQTIYLVDADI